MRILMLLDHFYPFDIRVEKEARTLVQAGHEVFLLSPGNGSAPAEETIQGMKVIRVPFLRGSLRWLWNSLWFQLFLSHPFWEKALTSVVRRYQVEAIHVHDLPLVKTGLQVAARFAIPLVADLHEVYPELVKIWRQSWKGRLFTLASSPQRWKRVEKYCVQHADRVLVVVDEAKEHCIRDCGILPEKVTTVMNVEDLDYFGAIPIRDEIVKKYEPYFTVCYIGGFGPHRGIQTAISAIPKIQPEIPNVRLLCVGAEPNQTKLKEKAVEFIGWQPFDLVPSYIAASKVCLVPHIASGHTNSTIPHKLFQYMAMGKPVVVSSARPLERIVNETRAGLVYPSGDADALAEAVIRIYRDEHLAAKLGQVGRKAVEERYNWKIEGEKLLNIYRGEI